MSLPPRYWIWQTFSGAVFRFDDAEADRINTRLDEWHDSMSCQQTGERGFIRSTDLAGVEMRLRIAHCDCFHECTTESRAWDNAVSKELAEESKDWSAPE